jgi:hypothetical protein
VLSLDAQNHGIVYAGDYKRVVTRAVSFGLAITLMCKLISCSNHSAFFDTKYCLFLLASIHLFKNSLQTRDIFRRISLNALGEFSSSPKRAINNYDYINQTDNNNCMKIGNKAITV